MGLIFSNWSVYMYYNKGQLLSSWNKNVADKLQVGYRVVTCFSGAAGYALMHVYNIFNCE